MTALDLLKGRKVKVMTDAKVEVTLEIEAVKEEYHSQEIGPSTRDNDWWPETKEWYTYEVKFTNGFNKTYSRVGEITIVDQSPTPAQ